MPKTSSPILCFLMFFLSQAAMGQQRVKALDFIDAFETPAARRFAKAVVDGDTVEALAASRDTPGGVNATGRSGETALLFATEHLDRPMMVALLKAGASPNGGPDRAPLHEAVKSESLASTTLLLQAGADPNGRSDGEPALYEAALIGAIPAAGILLSSGARVDEPNILGVTPSIVAASADHWRMVMFLLDHHASIWASSKVGLTIGSFAVDTRVRPDSDEGQAVRAIVERLKSSGFPWPPPDHTTIRKLRSAGNWPPKNPL